MATASKNRSAKSPKSRASVRRYVGKPAGVIQHRVEVAGPSHFGIVSVDGAKRRSKWMLLDFYGRVLVEPTDVEHNAGSLTAMTAQIKEAFAKFEIRDSIAASVLQEVRRHAGRQKILNCRSNQARRCGRVSEAFEAGEDSLSQLHARSGCRLGSHRC